MSHSIMAQRACVGGTSLSVYADGKYDNETAWIGSGGGFSHLFPAPEWQQPTVDNYTYDGHNYNPTNMRGVPDLALNAGAGTSAYVDGCWWEGLGTSFAAPSWAGLVALINQGLENSGQQPLG